jgi:hypothetical protein
MAEESTERLEQAQRELERLLGDQYDADEGLRTQTRKLLEEHNVRNASSIAATASEAVLMDYARLFFLEQQFEGMSPERIPQMFAFEMTDLRENLRPETTEPVAPYSGPTYDITSGPEAVTGENLATAYVERFGAGLPEGPLDHSDTIVTQADLQDAIEKYESIEITAEDIEAYQQQSIQELIDSRMHGIDPNDPEYAAQLESATQWAADMGLPTEARIVAALRHDRFTEEFPEMVLSEEQAQTLATDFNAADPAIIQNSSSVLSFYTDTAAARGMGMENYARQRADLLREIETDLQTEYDARISGQVAEVSGAIEAADTISTNLRGQSFTGIDRDAFEARQADMAAALEGGDYNTALNIANELTTTVIADLDAQQLSAIEARFETFQAAAAEAGYTIESPEAMLELLQSDGGEAFKQDIISAGGTPVRAFFQGEDGHPYTQIESMRRDALLTQSEIQSTAAMIEGVELTEVDATALTTRGVLTAESAAAPETDLNAAARGLIDEFRGENGGRIGPIIEAATGEGIDFERFSLASEIIPDLNARDVFDIDNPEDLAAALIAVETYKTGEIPSAERLAEIEAVVDSAYDSPDAITLDGTDPAASIRATFQAMVESRPSGAFRRVTEVGIPEGYDARLTPDNDGPAPARTPDALTM